MVFNHMKHVRATSSTSAIMGITRRPSLRLGATAAAHAGPSWSQCLTVIMFSKLVCAI